EARTEGRGVVLVLDVEDLAEQAQRRRVGTPTSPLCDERIEVFDRASVQALQGEEEQELVGRRLGIQIATTAEDRRQKALGRRVVERGPAVFEADDPAAHERPPANRSRSARSASAIRRVTGRDGSFLRRQSSQSRRSPAAVLASDAPGSRQIAQRKVS